MDANDSDKVSILDLPLLHAHAPKGIQFFDVIPEWEGDITMSAILEAMQHNNYSNLPEPLKEKKETTMGYHLNVNIHKNELSDGGKWCITKWYIFDERQSSSA